MPLEGKCACGAVRYRLESDPMVVHCCHCMSCQRESGSAFVVNGLIEADRVTQLQGSIETINTPSASGQGQRIIRCTDCKTALWSHYAYAGIGDLVRFVRLGTLDEPNAAPPDVHIYTESKQHWVQTPKDVPACTQYYSAKELWSAASLERRKALFAQAQ